MIDPCQTVPPAARIETGASELEDRAAHEAARGARLEPRASLFASSDALEVRRAPQGRAQASLGDPRGGGRSTSRFAPRTSRVAARRSRFARRTSRGARRTSRPARRRSRVARPTSRGGSSKVAGRSSNLARRSWKVARRSQELAQRSSRPAARGSEPARRQSEPAPPRSNPATLQTQILAAEYPRRCARAVRPSQRVVSPSVEGRERVNRVNPTGQGHTTYDPAPIAPASIVRVENAPGFGGSNSSTTSSAKRYTLPS